MKNEKKKKKQKQKDKIKTQNSHEFRSSFILNMNKKEYKRREFNHINTNPKKKKKTDKKLFSHFLTLRTKHKLPTKTFNQTPPKPAKTSPITPLGKKKKKQNKQTPGS